MNEPGPTPTPANAEHDDRTPAGKSSSLTPILIAIWTTAIAALGNGVVSWFNGRQMYALEQEKAQSAVILEVVKTNSPDKAAGNLAFLVEIGVISEEQAGERLKNYLRTRVAGQGPSIPQSGETSSGDASGDATCSPVAGDYVVTNVHLGDSDGGLNIRVGPNQTAIGVIPATAQVLMSAFAQMAGARFATNVCPVGRTLNIWRSAQPDWLGSKGRSSWQA